ncbi:MAG: zinc ribbon domain-containing protein [Candidatus Hodarchaeota archaeon]
MAETASDINEFHELIPAAIRAYFDGTKFLWRTAETRYLLKLIAFLFGFMIVGFTILAFLVSLNFPPHIVFYALLFFLALFLFIIIELARFYWYDRKYNLFPERNPFLEMKYWPSKMNEKRKRFRLTLLIGSLVFVFLLLLVAIVEIFSLTFEFVLTLAIVRLVIVFLFYFTLLTTAFVTANGTMRIFKAKYSESLKRKRFLVYILFPLPWIFLYIAFFEIPQLIVPFLPEPETLTTLEAILNVPVEILFEFLMGFFMYVFLCLLGLIALLKQKWRVDYTISQVSASIVFLIIIVIPGIIGFVISLLGTLISLLAMAFFYIQGALDEYGDELRQYYSAWDKKLEMFRITSEEGMLNRPEAFDKTPLPTNVPNAYRNLIFGIGLLFLTYFSIIFLIGIELAVMGLDWGSIYMRTLLIVNSFLEIVGISLGIFVTSLIFVFYRQQKISCSKCGSPNKPKDNFCVYCGQRL